MTKHCEDCGCKLRNGICSNCHEELYILTYQSADIEFSLSDEFMKAAAEQNRRIKHD